MDSTSQDLWDSTVEPLLRDDLWRDRDIYDAGHVLLAPLEAAFRGGMTPWQEGFAEHFARFVVAAEQGEVSESRLGRTHYYFLAAHFLSLASTSGHGALIPEGLPSLLFSELESVWHWQDAWQWEREPFRGMEARIEWKLDQVSVEPSYLRAIIDEELFTLALAADLRVFERATAAESSWSTTVSRVLDIAERVIRQESSFPDNGWIFQAGVWSDHPDYAYSGLTSPTADMVPTPQLGVPSDSSHAARWPVWAMSLRDSSPPGSARSLLYSDLIEKMGNQFAERIMVLPSADFPYLRMNNFVDGSNGLYRWNYETVPSGQGTEGYGLSGSLFVIWWGMLADTRVNEAFCDLSDSFPLSAAAVETYVGLNTTRERNPLVEWPAYFENGFAELNVRLMCQLGGESS